MGIGVVLLVYLVMMLVAAAIGSAVLTAMTARIVKPSTKHRKRAIRIAALLPFLCVTFAGVWFIFYAVVNDAVFHRDPGFGDFWQTPLPNGYALNAIDVTDYGEIYNPTRGDANESGAIAGVDRLQVSGKQIFGARDTQSFQHFGEKLIEDEFFSLDTTTGTKTAWKSETELNTEIRQEHLVPKLRGFAEVFEEYRPTWFDTFAALMGVFVPLLGIIAFIRWLFDLRRSNRELTIA